MRCQDAKQLLTIQRESALAESDCLALRQHLEQCPSCHAFEQHLHHVDALLQRPRPSAPSVRRRIGISTNQIMLAVEQQSKISQQLAYIHTQQRNRIERLRPGGTMLAALAFFTLGSIPLLLLAITITQTDLVANALYALGDIIANLFVIVQSLQAGLAFIAHNRVLLSGIAFAIVLMMGMWLRLMRPPREA